MPMEIKDLAKSEYYNVLQDYLDKNIESLKEPENDPIQDLVQANVKREKIIWLQRTKDLFKTLREDDGAIRGEDDYE